MFPDLLLFGGEPGGDDGNRYRFRRSGQVVMVLVVWGGDRDDGMEGGGVVVKIFDGRHTRLTKLKRA